MNVLIVDIDSLRVDHVGAYGYGAPTTPNVDALAGEGVRFERAYVANSPCLPSRAALTTGRYGIDSGVATHGRLAQRVRSPKTRSAWVSNWAEEWHGLRKSDRDRLHETSGASREWLTLPETFFHDRRPTVAVSSFPRHTAPWFYDVWSEYHHPREPRGTGEYFQTVRAEAVVDRARDVIERHADDDLFLYAQFWEPHAPYNRTDDERAPFRDVERPSVPDEATVQAHREMTAVSSATHTGIEDRAALEEMLAGYDAEIRHADEQVGRLLDALREAGVYEETFVVVTADHGEEFGERGVYRNHANVHEPTQHVPLVLKPPADAPVDPGTRTELVTNVDLAPTLADYAGLERPGRWQGRSLRPLLEADADDWRDHVVLDHGAFTAQRAIRTDRWKYVRTYHPGFWPETEPDHQLYDLDVDPWEQDDIADRHPDVVGDLRARMTVWADEHAGEDEDALKEVARNGPAGYLGFRDVIGE